MNDAQHIHVVACIVINNTSANNFLLIIHYILIIFLINIQVINIRILSIILFVAYSNLNTIFTAKLEIVDLVTFIANTT
jgi:hypothetical protein